MSIQVVGIVVFHAVAADAVAANFPTTFKRMLEEDWAKGSHKVP